MSYYDEIIAEIEQAIKNGSQEDAAYLIRRELSMPYIPSETEEKLRSLAKQVRAVRAESSEPKELTTEALLRKLKGKPQSQLQAADALCGRNLRDIVPELQDWFSKDPQPEAASLLIDALAEQEVSAEFTISRDGIEYTFYGDAVTPVAKSEGFRGGLRLLERWFLKDPSLAEMARSLLIQKCYNALPLCYEAEDAVQLAEDCAAEVLRSMGMEERITEIRQAARDEHHGMLS